MSADEIDKAAYQEGRRLAQSWIDNLGDLKCRGADDWSEAKWCGWNDLLNEEYEKSKASQK